MTLKVTCALLLAAQFLAQPNLCFAEVFQDQKNTYRPRVGYSSGHLNRLERRAARLVENMNVVTNFVPKNTMVSVVLPEDLYNNGTGVVQPVSNPVEVKASATTPTTPLSESPIIPTISTATETSLTTSISLPIKSAEELAPNPTLPVETNMPSVSTVVAEPNQTQLLHDSSSLTLSTAIAGHTGTYLDMIDEGSTLQGVISKDPSVPIEPPNNKELYLTSLTQNENTTVTNHVTDAVMNEVVGGVPIKG